MADRYGPLSQTSITASGGYDVCYTVPTPTVGGLTVGTIAIAPLATSIHVQTMVTGIQICNTDSTAGTFSMRLVTYRNGSAVTTQLKVLYPYGANQDMTLRMGVLLTSGLDASTPPVQFGDVISVDTVTGALDVTIFGIEMTVGMGADVS